MSPILAAGAAGVMLLSPLTFVPGCELVSPKVRSHPSGPGRPVPRDRFASVDVFLAGQQPGRRYVVVGEVEIQSGSRNASVLNLLDHARREARKLGGDAVVDVRLGQIARPSRGARAGGAERLTLTGKVVRWSPVTRRRGPIRASATGARARVPGP